MLPAPTHTWIDLSNIKLTFNGELKTKYEILGTNKNLSTEFFILTSKRQEVDA